MLGTGIAEASPPVYSPSHFQSTTGAYGGAGVDSFGRSYIQICDVKADGDSAYIWWNYGTSTHTPTNRIETTGGNGTCDTEYVPTSEVSVQVSRDIPGNPDNHAPWFTVRF